MRGALVVLLISATSSHLVTWRKIFSPWATHHHQKMPLFSITLWIYPHTTPYAFPAKITPNLSDYFMRKMKWENFQLPSISIQLDGIQNYNCLPFLPRNHLLRSTTFLKLVVDWNFNFPFNTKMQASWINDNVSI